VSSSFAHLPVGVDLLQSLASERHIERHVSQTKANTTTETNHCGLCLSPLFQQNCKMHPHCACLIFLNEVLFPDEIGAIDRPKPAVWPTVLPCQKGLMAGRGLFSSSFSLFSSASCSR
jgi:hypothetical protein